MICSYCQQRYYEALTLTQLFSFSKLTEGKLCQVCSNKFVRYTVGKRCKGCYKNSSSSYCEDCLLWKKQYPDYHFKHEALYHYNEEMKEWFKQFKFKGDFNLANSFSTDIAKYFKTKRNWLVVPIPMSPDKEIERGFNQVIALLEQANVHYINCLKKESQEIRQSHKNKKERFQTKQPFYLNEKFCKSVKDGNILLVDDIYTTGRTMFFAAECLRKAAPKCIQTFSLVR